MIWEIGYPYRARVSAPADESVPEYCEIRVRMHMTTDAASFFPRKNVEIRVRRGIDMAKTIHCARRLVDE